MAKSNSEKLMQQKSSSIDIQDLQDIHTPFGVPLSGVYKRSFAYATIKDRLPVILTKVIDILSRNKEPIAKIYGQDALDDIKYITGFISKLKNELVTNKTLKPLRLNNAGLNNDANEWNKYLLKRTDIEGEIPTWFNTIWLYCECYMYRVLAQEIGLTSTLHSYDPFEQQKQENFINSINSINMLSSYIMNLVCTKESISGTEKKLEFMKLLKLGLWGNRCDLSLSAGSDSSQCDNPLELLESLNKNIIANDSKYAWNIVRKKKVNDVDTIDIILDNAGYELFTDICLAVFLCTHDLVKKIRFYVKLYPWYVSDTTINDFRWTLEYMNSTSSSSDLQALAQLSSTFLKNNVWSIEKESYWTGPYDYAQMKEKNPSLYAKLSEAKLVIFKGDLNYRKLVGDINFEYTTNFLTALRGFRPTNILCMRTVKADVCVGLPYGKAESLFEKDENWMITGKYGLLQATIDPNCQCSDDETS